MTDKVLVSGGSGYIAGFLIRQLVAEGWRVHTTIRNLAKEAEVRKLLKVDDSRLRFFAADLTPRRRLVRGDGRMQPRRASWRHRFPGARSRIRTS